MQKNFMGRREKSGRLNVVIAYDTAEMGRRAMRALRSAIDGAREARPAVDLRLWRLDLLADGELRELANAELRKADMLLFAIQGVHALPSTMDSWLREFTRKEEGIRGLALLVGNDEPESGGLTRFTFGDLRSRAKANHIDFITNVSERRDESLGEVAWSSSNDATRHSAPLFDTFEHVESHRAWGIND